MKPKHKPKIVEEEEDLPEDKEANLDDRLKDYSNIKLVEDQLGRLFDAVDAAYNDKSGQNGIIDECWDIYHCELNDRQSYVGTSNVYVPIVRDALTARETRFVNMLFPGTQRYVDIVGSDGHVPYDLVGLMDYYVRQAKIRQLVAPALIRTGDITGQYALYIDWVEHKRNVTSKKKVPEITTEDGRPVEETPEYDDIEYEEIIDARPGVKVLDARDYVMLPVSAEQPPDCDIISITLKLTKSAIKHRIKEKIFTKEAGEQLLDNLSAAPKKQPNTAKKASKFSGVTTDSKGNKVALVQQVWSRLKLNRAGDRRMMVTHFAGADLVLGCKRNPYWCDRVPLLSQPVEKNPDSIWGPSQVYPVAQLQYEANDAANKGFDSSSYALLPIVMTDPEKNPRAGSMILTMASVWLCDPNSTKFAEFPALWKDAFAIVGSCKDQIFQSLGVNPAMIPHGNAGKKPSQAQIAQEQQVALESSADNVALVQEGMLSDMIEWFYELDYQYRTKDITIKKFGELGLQATMDQVPPMQERQHYEFKWYGTEGFKAAQQVQQQIAWLNVLKGLPPQVLNGRKLDLGPALEVINGTILGPRLAPRVLIDQRHQLTMTAELENKLIEQGFPVQVHEMDDDHQHIESHYHHFEQVLQLPPQLLEVSDVARIIKGHILEHIKALKMKAQAAQGAQPGQMGAPGQPKSGAQPQVPTGNQNPPGAVAPDNMPTAMPRA